ncbi:MAG TPA: serpin family protein, partial [Candidatus Angelobacter sp.]|nr:serpin family protein [Candidatus Angelobacter sp.]
MKIYFWCLPFSLLASMAFAQTTKSPAPAKATAPSTPVVVSQEQIEKSKMSSAALNQFGLKLVSDVASRDRHKNLFVSPLSLFMALAMTESGAEGATRSAMRQTLAIPAGVSEDAVHESAAALMKALQSQKGIELSIANALWSDTTLPLAEDYVARCRKFYQAEATTLDFSKGKAAADTINGWVKQKTHDKIPGIVDEGSLAGQKALLTNAVYFRGRWVYQFSRRITQDAPFHLLNGGQKKVPMMHRPSIRDAYRSGHGFEAAALPYEDSEAVLYAILPAPGHSPEEALAAVKLDELRMPSESNELDLRLPRFTLDFGPAPLKTTLTRMGMGPAFEGRGEFQPMGSPLFFV